MSAATTGTGTNAATIALRLPMERVLNAAAAMSRRSLRRPTTSHRLTSSRLLDRTAEAEPIPTTKSLIPTVRVMSTNEPDGSSAVCILSTDRGASVSVSPTPIRSQARRAASVCGELLDDKSATLAIRWLTRGLIHCDRGKGWFMLFLAIPLVPLLALALLLGAERFERGLDLPRTPD